MGWGFLTRFYQQLASRCFAGGLRLKSFLYDNTDKNIAGEVCVLEKNYRNSKQVIELANRILHLKNYCFAPEDKMTANEKEAFFMKSDTRNTGNVSFIADNKKGEVAKKVSQSIMGCFSLG